VEYGSENNIVNFNASDEKIVAHLSMYINILYIMKKYSCPG